MLFDVAMVAIIALIAFSCKKKGIIKCVMGLASTVLAIILTCALRGPLIEKVKTTPFYANLYQKVAEKVAENLTAGNTSLITALAGDAIVKGTQAITEAVIASLLSVVLSAILFAVIIFVLRLLTNAVSSVAKLPGLNFINSICGLLWGTVFGLALFYAAFAVWAFFTGYSLPKLFEGSYLAKSMFETNLLLLIFS